MAKKICKVAIVEMLVGDRKMCAFLGAAGLGINGVGCTETIRITYKPGEEVDEARVMKAINAMIAESEAVKTDFKIMMPKVVAIRDEEVEVGE